MSLEFARQRKKLKQANRKHVKQVRTNNLPTIQIIGPRNKPKSNSKQLLLEQLFNEQPMLPPTVISGDEPSTRLSTKSTANIMPTVMSPNLFCASIEFFNLFHSKSSIGFD